MFLEKDRTLLIYFLIYDTIFYVIKKEGPFHGTTIYE